jgi:DNA polymerase
VADDSRENLEEIRFFRDLGFREIYLEAPARAPAAVPPVAARPRAAPGLRPTAAGPAPRDAVPFDPSGRPVVPVGFASLPALAEFTAGCPRCKLSASRTHLVFGQGNPNADLMFVGEAPGADEDAQGLAFVGRAGQLLTKIVEAIGLTREQGFIANVLK